MTAGILGTDTGPLVTGAGGSMPAARSDATNELSIAGAVVAGAAAGKLKDCSTCGGAGKADISTGGVGECDFAVEARSCASVLEENIG